jgi:hypothetical protein
MSNKLNINDHIMSKTRIDDTKYTISVFYNDTYLFNFKVSLQPTGKDNILPIYQFYNNTKNLPKWITENTNNISDWICREP